MGKSIFISLNNIFIILTGCILTFHTCTYQPEDIYNLPEIDKPESPEIQIVNLDTNLDSIFLYRNEISLKFTTSNQQIKLVKFIIDNGEYTGSTTDNKTFSLNYLNLPEGSHELTVQVFTGSGSGSIADILGAEGFMFSKTWKLIIDWNPSEKLNSIVEDGFLKIYWPQYKSFDFKEYIIYRINEYYDETEIARSQSTHIIDSCYVGEGGIYLVKVNTKENQLIPWGDLQLEKDMPKMYFSDIGENQYIVKWNKCKYYNAVALFKLTQKEDHSIIENEVFSSQNHNDTIFFIQKAFYTQDLTFVLTIIPKKFNTLYNYNKLYFQSWEFGFPGIRFSNSNNQLSYLYQVSNHEFTFVSNCDSLIRFSVLSGSNTEKIGYYVSQCGACKFSFLRYSPSGKYMTNMVTCNEFTMLINSNNFTNFTETKIKDLVQYYMPEVPVSDNGLGIVNNAIGGFDLYDLNTYVKIASYNKPDVGGKGKKISMNGEYIFLEDDSLRLVKYENFNFTNIWGVKTYNNIKFYDFSPLEPNHLWIWNGSVFSIKQCDDFSTIHEFSLTDKSILNIDYYNNEILTTKDGHLLVRNFTNGSLIKDIPVSFNTSDWSNACILVNHTIVSMQGVLYRLNQ